MAMPWGFIDMDGTIIMIFELWDDQINQLCARVARGVALSPAGCEVSKELRRTAIEDQVGDVDTALVFVEGGNPLDAVGDVKLTANKARDGFSFEGPETI